MGGSLAALATQFPKARLKLDHLGAVVGEAGFGPLSQAVSAGLEGALFGAMMVLALGIELRRETASRSDTGSEGGFGRS
jgi:hypothetical protein